MAHGKTVVLKKGKPLPGFSLSTWVPNKQTNKQILILQGNVTERDHVMILKNFLRKKWRKYSRLLFELLLVNAKI
jgi:hypothetical protein